MLDLLQETWDRIQGELRGRVGDAAYQSWLAGLRPLALERSVCYLEAANRMACERVQRLYVPLLEECLSAGIGTRVTVDVAPRPESLLPDALEVSPTQPVVDDSNSTAVLVLKALLEKERQLPSSLFFFYGEAGVGKSFLVRWWRDLAPGRPAIHDGLALRKAFQLKVRDHAVDQLQAELVGERPIVIDGVHRFARHTRAQQELLKALKRRHELGALTLLTSRWHPHDIWDLEPGLQSFLLSGFVAQIQVPGLAARLRYLRALEGAASRNGRATMIEDLARQVHGSFPELQRAWAIERHGQPRQRGNYLRLIDPGREFRELRDRVAERLGVSAEELCGKSQSRRVTFARQVLAWLAVQAGLSQAEVARHMNGRSRASIGYCVKTVERRMAEDSSVRALVEGLL